MISDATSSASNVTSSAANVTASSPLAAQPKAEQIPSKPLYRQDITDQKSNGAKRNIDPLLVIYKKDNDKSQSLIPHLIVLLLTYSFPFISVGLNDDSFDSHKRRRYIINYMIDIDRSWEPLTRWNLHGLDITEKFQQFRNRSILLADAKHNISDNRILSLSNIFTITPCQSTSCLHRFSPTYYKSILKVIKRKQGFFLDKCKSHASVEIRSCQIHRSLALLCNW